MLAGRPNEFDRLLKEAVAGPDGYAPPGAIANLYISAGRYEDGLDWLGKAFRERSNNMVYLGVEPNYDGVRDHPRFKGMVQAIGLP